MTYVHYDRISETTTTSGTANLVVSGAMPGARPWSTLADGEQFVYCLEEGTSYEIADGTWTAGTSTITRGTLHSSTTGAKLKLSGSGATVMLIVSSKWIQDLEATIAANAAAIAGFIPGTTGTPGQFLQTVGVGTPVWASAVHAFWSEGLTGHLLPATTNTHDIGTTSRKVRSIYIGTNATVDGVLTVAGTNVINYMNSIGLVAATNSADIDALQAALPLTGQAFGYRVSNNTTDAEHDLDIAAGACLSWDRTTWLAGTAKTKRFDAAWSAGSGNGGLDVGATMPTSGGLYVYAIYHPANGVDYIGSITGPTTGPALPSGYTKYAYLGFWATDTSANFEQQKQFGNYFERFLQSISYTATNPGTSAVTVTLSAPMRATVDVGVYFAQTGSTVLLHITSGDYTPVAGTPGDNGTLIKISTFASMQRLVRIPINDSRQLKYDVNISDGTTIVQMRAEGWTDNLIPSGLGI